MTLRREAERIYAALFSEPVPDVIAERFSSASPRLDERADPEELQAYWHVLEHIHDLEAVEVAGRYTKRLGILSRKFHLMTCLAETIPQDRTSFIKDNDTILGAYAALVSGALRTSAKILKGLVLLRNVNRA